MKFYAIPRCLLPLLTASLMLPHLCCGALTWENQRVELSTKAGDKQAVGVYHFKNSGTTPVTITAVKPSCGCTTAELTKPTYAPGEAGEIKAVFTLGERLGQQEKTIQVTTADDPAKPVQLVLRVNIPQLFTCTPRLLLWHLKEEPAEKSVLITPSDTQKISTIEVKNITPAIAAARIEPVPSSPNFRLFVHPKATDKPTQIALSCLAKFADGTTHPFTTYILVR